jgi:hypothetical protein
VASAKTAHPKIKLEQCTSWQNADVKLLALKQGCKIVGLIR